jgi:hypothetical protein
MDINLNGSFWGWPVNLAGQISDPSIWNNAVLAAALSALLVSLANLLLDRRRYNKIVNQRRQQVYIMLRGRNAVIAEFYETYASEFIHFHI